MFVRQELRPANPNRRVPAPIHPEANQVDFAASLLDMGDVLPSREAPRRVALDPDSPVIEDVEGVEGPVRRRAAGAPDLLARMRAPAGRQPVARRSLRRQVRAQLARGRSH